MKHKHANVIHAWADGKIIEFQDGSGHWVLAMSPVWSTATKYRIKPETLRYRVALMYSVTNDSRYLDYAHNDRQAIVLEERDTFVKWLDHVWREVEV